MLPIGLLRAVACIAITLHFCISVAVAEDDRGSSAWAMRAQAAQTLPLDELSPQARQETQRIIESASVFRRMPATTIDADPDLYLFCLRYPEIVVDIWRLMGVSSLTIQRTGQYTLKTNDGAGTTSTVELIYGTPTLHMFIAKGRYSGPRLLKPIDGTCLMVMHTEYSRGVNGKPQATSSMDVFLNIENNSADWIARMIHPIFGSTADHNFVESLRFLEKLSDTTIENGPGVQGMAKKLSKVHPEVRNRFSQILGMVYDRYFYQSMSIPDDSIATGYRAKDELQRQPASTTLSDYERRR